MKSYFNIGQIILVVLYGACMGGWLSYGEYSDGAPMEEVERAALYSAIQGFVGGGWNGSDLYPDPCGWTPIQGVSCDVFDGLWYVTDLNIGPVHDNSLECAPNVEFRPQLFQLKYLKSLSFFNCFHSHPITISSYNWQNLAATLEVLEFRSNPGLIGQVPFSFGDLIKLQSLVLVENGLAGEIPENIGSIARLKRLVLAGNLFHGKIPDSFGGLSELLIMDLSGNLLSGFLPLTFGGLTSLLKLDLSNNQLGGSLPSGVSNFKNLTILDLRNNKFSSGLRKSLEELYSLEEMALSGNPIGGNLQGIEWQQLINLAVLDLGNTGLKGEIPESIVGLKKLRFLGLSDNNLTGNPPPILETLPCLSALYLNGNNLTGELKFSGEFYEKMGRRFGAWNNPNLCFQSGSMSPSCVPYGVRPCQVTLLQPNSNSKLADASNLIQNSQFVTSLGLSSKAVGGFLWGFSTCTFMMILLLGCFL